MKIFAVGMNYALHNAELTTALGQQPTAPEEPTIFTKADSSLLKDGKPFFLPDHLGRIDYETELVVRLCRLGKTIEPRFASRYYDAVTVGMDFTARDLQQRLRAEGKPWELCKGFDGAALIGDFVPLTELPPVEHLNFRAEINGHIVQQGNTRDMLTSVDHLISYISQFFTLKTGDLLFTGTPVGVGPVHIGDHIEGFLEGRKVLISNVR